ncbi:LSM domain-containing protein [Cryptosporidium serpentis]
MQKYINYRVRVTVQDDRMLVGNLMAFDKHMNVVLSDCQEYRSIKKKGEDLKEVKRSLGFIVLRGENIVTITAEAPPKSQSKRVTETPSVGNVQVIGRGTVIPAVGTIPGTIMTPGHINIPMPALGSLPIITPGVGVAPIPQHVQPVSPNKKLPQ